MTSGTTRACAVIVRRCCVVAVLVSTAGCGAGDSNAPSSVSDVTSVSALSPHTTPTTNLVVGAPLESVGSTALPSVSAVPQFAPVERRISTARIRFVHAGSPADGPVRVYWGSVPAPNALAAELQPGEASEAVAALVPAAEVENVVSWSVFPATATSSADAWAIADMTLDDGEQVVWAIGAPPPGGKRRPTAQLRSAGPDGFPAPFAAGATVLYVIEPGVVTLGARDVVGYTDGETCLAVAGEDRGDVLLRELEPGVRSLAVFSAGTDCSEPTSAGAFVDPSISRRFVAVIGGTERERRLVVFSL